MTFQTSLRKSDWPFRVTLAVGLGLFCNAQVDSIYAQNWSKTMAPNTDWVSIACSADGAKLIAAAVSDVRGASAGDLYLCQEILVSLGSKPVPPSRLGFALPVPVTVRRCSQ